MDDLGPPASYLVLGPGAPVYSADGERLGRVKEVRADEERDIFDGLVLERGMLTGDERYVPAEQVEEVFERGVALKLSASAVDELARPR